MFLLMQGSILLDGQVSIFPNVSSLSNIFLCASHHVVYVAWTQVVVVYEVVVHSSIKMFTGWLQLPPRVKSLKDCDHLVPNQRSFCNEQV